MRKLRLGDFEGDTDIGRGDYERQLVDLQHQLRRIQAAYIVQGLRGIVAIEGWDASGKGGLIQRMTQELDHRYTDVWSIGAPSAEELAHGFLWRFWRRLPAAREIVVFDRTWYGRVLVERVDKLTPEADWQRGYDEINAFEAQQLADGTRLVKLFMHTTQAEQDKRLIERLEVPYKRWKTGLDDYRNRSKRAEYLEAYHDMFDRTDTELAPWTVIAADDKKASRIAGIAAVVAGLGAGIDLDEPPVSPELRAVAEAALGVTLKL